MTEDRKAKVSSLKNVQLNLPKVHSGPRNSFLLFLPFLVIYLVIAVMFSSDEQVGDEARYIQFATNIIHGFYSPPLPDIDLSNGPGYPLLILPFIGLKLPIVYLTFLNAILLYLSNVLIFRILIRFASYRLSLAMSIFWALNYNVYPYISLVYSEVLAIFLVTLFIEIVSNGFYQNTKINWLSITSAGLVLGLLILTKVIFFYVLLGLIIVLPFLTLIHRDEVRILRFFLIIFTVAFLAVSPYLIYTYSLTGRLFLLTTKSDNLYWMSTPFKGEYGDWFSIKNVTGDISDRQLYDGIIIQSNTRYGIQSEAPDPGWKQLHLNHGDNYSEILQFKGLERYDAFRQKALENIQNHPVKFIQNWMCNIGRLFFNMPYSYSIERPRTILRFIYTGILVFFALLSILPSIRNWKMIVPSVRFTFLFVLIYLLLSSILSAEIRMLSVVMPAILVWIAYILERSIIIRLQPGESK